MKNDCSFILSLLYFFIASFVFYAMHEQEMTELKQINTNLVKILQLSEETL